eukprot:TRINITY_DN8082_c0_g2_i1.p1 TRINITY_DN8082_c0_g2~~TRINITY_DN8082_c0_g2_i1.p1  ORF type:complete len:2139 (-),score=460.70 TRINITY_DN8082_c0_g2_i1:3587-10003(-)
MELKTQYNRAVMAIRAVDVNLPEPERTRVNNIQMLVNRALLDEEFASKFHALGERDFMRTLYSQAMHIRMTLRDIVSAEESQAHFHDHVVVHAVQTFDTLRELYDDVDDWGLRQGVRVAADWSALVRGTVVQPPDGYSRWSVDAMRKHIELYEATMQSCPRGYETGRNNATLILWEHHTSLVIAITVEKLSSTDAANLMPTIVKAVRVLPLYVPASNQTLQQLWSLLLRCSVEQPLRARARLKKRESVWTRNSTFVRFLHLLYNKYSRAVSLGEIDEQEAAAAFPLFPEVCRQFALLYLDQANNELVIEYSLKELHLRLQLTRGPLAPLLQGWDRLYDAYLSSHTPAETYQFVRTLLDDIRVADCEELYERAERSMRALQSRGEVQQFERYMAQLEQCIMAVHEEAPACVLATEFTLHDVLDSLTTGELSDVVMAAACAQLAELYTCAHDYVHELMLTENFVKAREILENMLNIRGALRSAKSSLLVADTHEDERLWEVYVTCSIRLYSDAMRVADTSLKQDDAFDFVRNAYRHRPFNLPHSNGVVQQLWSVVQHSPHLKAFCEEECTQYFQHKEIAMLLYQQSLLRRPVVVAADSKLLSEDNEQQASIEKLSDTERKALLGNHPLLVHCMMTLGTLYMNVSCGEEAGRILKECLDVVTFGQPDDPVIIEVWDRVYSVLVQTTNPFTVLAFIDSEQQRRVRAGMSHAHPLIARMEAARVQIRDNEVGKLHYMYQVRCKEEYQCGGVPSRLLSLNDEYASLFKQRGYTEDGAQLLLSSLELLRLSGSSDSDPRFMSIWRRLADYKRELAEKYATLGQYRRARECLEIALDARPPLLDCEDDRIQMLVEGIVKIFNIDPDTMPAPSMSPIETAAFQWVYTQFRRYEVELTDTCPGIAAAFDLVGSIERFSNAAKRGVDNWKLLLQRFPHMGLITAMLGSYYFQAHHAASVAYSQHAARIMALCYAPKSDQARAQWHTTKKYFMDQRRTDEDTLDFVNREALFMSVLLPADHPFLHLLEEDRQRQSNRMVFFQQYLVAAWYYAIYAAIIVAIVLSIPSLGSLMSYFNLDNVVLYVAVFFTEFVLFAASVFLVIWPTVPISESHRALALLERTACINAFDEATRVDNGLCLLIPCHNSAGVLPTTLAAALKIFPPERIYICDNGNSACSADNSEQVVARISRDYNRLHKRGPNAGVVNYCWIPEGNKSLAIWWVTKHRCRSKYVMIMDDDVILPVPDHYWCKELTKCTCEGGRSLLRQRMTSWDPTAHRFVFEYIELLLLYWSRYAIILKPFLVYELWTIIQDYLRWPLFVWILIRSPIAMMRGLSITVAVQYFLLCVFDYYVFRYRPDQRIPLRVIALFPLYRFLALWLRFAAVIYNFLFYLPFVRNPLKVKDRKNLPLGPEQKQQLTEYSAMQSAKLRTISTDVRLGDRVESMWATIGEHLRKRHPPQSNFASHWFLSCIINVCRNKDAPLLPTRMMTRSKTERFDMIDHVGAYFYAHVTHPSPPAFLTCLDVMCFMTGRARCMGTDSDRAARVLKWLWVDDCVAPTNPLSTVLDEYARMTSMAMPCQHIVQFMQRVLLPAMKLMYPFMDTHQLKCQMLFLSPVLRLLQSADVVQTPAWCLEHTSLQDGVPVMEHHSSFFDSAGVQSLQHFSILVPVLTESGLVRGLTAILVHPQEKWILVRNALEQNFSAAFAVLWLLHKFDQDRMSRLYEVYTCSGHGELVIRTAQWSVVQQEASRFFEHNASMTPRPSAGISSNVSAGISRTGTATQLSSRRNSITSARSALGARNRGNCLHGGGGTLRQRGFLFDVGPKSESDMARSLQRRTSSNVDGSELGEVAKWDDQPTVLLDNDEVDVNRASVAGFWLRPVADIMQRPILFINEKYELMGRYAFIDPFIGKMRADEVLPFLVFRVVPQADGVQYEILWLTAGSPSISMILDYLNSYMTLLGTDQVRNLNMAALQHEDFAQKSEQVLSNRFGTSRRSSAVSSNVSPSPVRAEPVLDGGQFTVPTSPMAVGTFTAALSPFTTPPASPMRTRSQWLAQSISPAPVSAHEMLPVDAPLTHQYAVAPSALQLSREEQSVLSVAPVSSSRSRSRAPSMDSEVLTMRTIAVPSISVTTAPASARLNDDSDDPYALIVNN